MALLPKSYFNNTRIKRFAYRGIDIFEAEYTSKNNKSKCYHKHKGTANQTTANGCYTQKENYGGKCQGHIQLVGTGRCRCGAGIPCTNRVCGYSDENGLGAEVMAEKTTYCTTSTGCNNWKWEVRYALGCGYNAD